jgi:hypothetical protein
MNAMNSARAACHPALRAAATPALSFPYDLDSGILSAAARRRRVSSVEPSSTTMIDPFVRLGSDAAKRFVDRRAGVESRNDYTDQVRTGTH